MKTTTLLKTIQLLALTGLALGSEVIQTAQVDREDFLSIPVLADTHSLQGKEILGGAWSADFTLRQDSLLLAQMIHQQAQTRLAKQHKELAGPIARAVLGASLSENMDPLFVLAVIQTESRFNPVAIGRHGEIGLMQIRPQTAKWIAQLRNIPWRGAEALKDPEYNIRLAVSYFSLLRARFAAQGSDYISAYNLGVTKLLRMKKKDLQPAIYYKRVRKNYTLMNHELRLMTQAQPAMVALSE